MKKQGKMHYAWWIMIASAAIYAASVGIIVSCAGLLYRTVAQDFGVGVSEISLYTSIDVFNELQSYYHSLVKY